MIIDNIGWNVEIVRGMTRKEFISNPQHHALYWRITDANERRKALSAAYNLIIGSRPEPIQITEQG